MVEVGAADWGVELGGCGCPDLRIDLLIGGSVGHALRVGEVGHDTAHWESFGWIPPQGGLQADGEATSERTGRSMGLSPAGGRDGGGGIAGGGDLCLPLS